MKLDEPIDPDLISTSARVDRPIDGGADVLRQLVVDVEYAAESGQVTIGSMSAWIGWSIGEEDIHDAADAISSDAEVLGAVAADILDQRADLWIDSVLLLDRMYLDPSCRGHRLARSIVGDLLGLLRLDPETTLTVLYPEPQRPEGGPMPDGPEREASMERLTSAYRASGFEPWKESGVWWLPIR